MEIAGREPVGVEDLFGFGTADRVQQQALELVVGESVLLAGTDVIVVVPEFSRHIRTADTLKQSSAVFDRRPLQHTADRHMEHDRVVVLEDRRIENTRLTKRYPGLDARVGDDAFCERFSQPVVVVRGHADRVAGTTPMKRFTAVTHLGYRTDIHHFGLLVLGLCEHGLGDVVRRGDVGAQRRFGTVVRLRGHHATHMQHDVGTRHTLEHVLVVGEVAPNDG